MNKESLRFPRWLPASLLLAAFALRFWDLGAQSLWYDEAFCWWAATIVSAKESIALSIREIVPPFGYLMLRGWVLVAGSGEFALRAPSALLGVVAAAAAGRLTWRMTRQQAGAIAALALFSIAPPLLWASREVRLYGMALGFTLVAGMALVETLFGDPLHRRRWAWIWGGATLASLYTLILSGFWLIGQGLFALPALFRHDRRTRLAWFKAMLPPAVVAAGLFLPWLIAASRSVGANRGYWPGYLPPAVFFRTALQGMTVVKLLPPFSALLAGGLIALFATPTLFLVCRRHPWAGLYVLCYALPPLLILNGIYREIPKWEPRHAVLFAPAPFLALAASWGAARGLPTPRSRWIATALLGLGAALLSIPLVQADANLLWNPAYTHEDWRAAAGYVQAHRRPGDAIIIETGSVFPAWGYYAGWDGMLPLPADDLLDVTHILDYRNTAPTLNAKLHAGQGVWVVTWLAEVTDPTAIVPALLADLGTEQTVPAFHQVGLRHFVLERAPDFPPEPPATGRPAAELLGGIVLWGYQLPQPPQRADAPLDIRTWWTTDDPTAHRDRFYQVALRLYDAKGEEWARTDGTPGGGDYRPERWAPETPVLGRFSLELPPGIPPGRYTLALILYEGGTTASPITLGQVQLTRPTHPPQIPPEMTPVLPATTPTPLQLLAVGLDRPALRSCETLSGLLFWEVSASPATVGDVQVALGSEQVRTPLTADFTAEQWQPGDRFLTRFRLPIGCRALETEAPLTITLLAADNVTAEAAWSGPQARIKADRQFAPPEGISPLTAQIGPGVATLLGYRLEPAPPAAERPFTLTLYWQAPAITDTPYTVFVHVTPPDASSPALAQHDAWPGLGDRATFTWVPGEVIADPHPLPALPPGDYALRIGFYGPDGVRLSVTEASGPVENDAIVLPLSPAK